jgi:hypothetical protein
LLFLFSGWVIPSNIIANIKIASPEAKPYPATLLVTALKTSTTNPSAPIIEAITTMDSDNMIVWLTPAIIKNRPFQGLLIYYSI